MEPVDRTAQCFIGETVCRWCGLQATTVRDRAVFERECSADPSGHGVHCPAANTENRGDGQQRGYVVLCDEERAKGFVRPVRRSYKHLKCGTVTTMGQRLAETYARDPSFYSGTFCCGCGSHFPVGADGEFVWDGTNEKVGT